MIVVVFGLASCGADERAVPTQAAPTPATADRDIVYTADLVVSVRHPDRAADRATDLVEQAGGSLFSQQADLEHTDEVRVTFHVPPARFRSVLDRLGRLGTTLSRSSTATDVTDDVVDLQGRLDGARASAARLRTLLGGADSTADVISIERELETREASIESMEGRLRTLHGQVDMASIDARFTEEHRLTVDHGLPSFLDGLRTGAVVFATAGVLALAVAGFVLPFLPVIVFLVLLLVWVGRRRARPS